MIAEGQSVKYAGDDPFTEVGTKGKVIALSGSLAHVQWQEGAKRNQVEGVEIEDLVPNRRAAAATVETPLLTTSMIREAADEEGIPAVIDMLDDSGHLATLAPYAAEAIGFLGAQLRTDESFRSVLAAIDPSDVDALVERTATVLLASQVTEGD